MKNQPPEIATLYLATEVTVQENGSWTSAFDYCMKNDAEFHVITAWNPGDERFGAAQNSERNQLLLIELQALGCQVFDARGSDPKSDYYEYSWAAIGLSDEQAMVLGRKYEQVAIFKIDDSRQSVLACFDIWEVTRANPKPIGMDQISQWVNSPRHHSLLEEHLSKYCGIGDDKVGYEGRQFEWFIQNRDTSKFSSSDILAIGALSVEVPATTARILIEDVEGEYGRILGECIAYETGNSQGVGMAWLWSEGSPFLDLFEALGNEKGVGKVVRSKLMAAKFPHLIPIRDSKVEALLAWEKKDPWWAPLHQLLEETSATLSSLKTTPECETTNLRKLDIILWMEASIRGL